MPSSVAQELLTVVVQWFLEVFCYYLGRWMVPVISLGRVGCDALGDTPPQRSWRTAGLYQRRGERVFLTVETTQLVGLVGLGLIVGGAVLLWYQAGE